MATKSQRNGVGLALSGGAARGIAHAGVLEVLVEAAEKSPLPLEAPAEQIELNRVVRRLLPGRVASEA